MTDVLVKPAFQSLFPDSGEATKFGPNAWNAARLFSGGVDGDLAVRDSGSATGASWIASVAAGQVLVSMGAGVKPAYSATPSVTAITASRVNVDEIAAVSGGVIAVSASDLRPTGDATNDMGSSAKRWRQMFADAVYLGTLTSAAAAPAVNAGTGFGFYCRNPANTFDRRLIIGGDTGVDRVRVGDAAIPCVIDGTVLSFNGTPRFNGTNTTGSGSAALGTNCPAGTPSSPYTWIQVTTLDGSIGYMPIWK